MNVAQWVFEEKEISEGQRKVGWQRERNKKERVLPLASEFFCRFTAGDVP